MPWGHCVLLEHRQLTSTQVYLHLTVRDLRKAIRNHPVERLAPTIEMLLPSVKLPFQHPPGASDRKPTRATQSRLTG